MDQHVDIKDPVKITNASNRLNECNQCDYLFHHLGNIKQKQPMWQCIVSLTQFEATYDGTQWGKVLQLHPV